MIPSSFPCWAWILLPNYVPQSVEIIGFCQETGRLEGRGHTRYDPKLVHESRKAAIDFGYAVLADQQKVAAIRARKLYQRRATLDKLAA